MQPCFYLTVWFQRSYCDALLVVTIIWHDFRFMVKSASGECQESDLRLTNGVLSLCGDGNWLGDSWLGAVTSKVGTTTQEKFKVLPFRVKIQGLALIACVWKCSCWRHCFVSKDFSLGWKLKIYDRAMMMLALFSSWRRYFWRSWNSGAVLVVLVLLLQEIDHCSRTFSFL
jgi:hypothetical protein